MRPLGAIVLGAYIDDVGRRKGLIVTLSIMASGTILIVLVPGYESIGLFAPALVLIGRLLQGFSAGAELGGVSVYLAEIATPGRKGFFTAWQSASQQVAIIVAAALGYALNAWMAPEVVADWGWRIPFFVGCMIVPFIFSCAVTWRKPKSSPHANTARAWAKCSAPSARTGAWSSAAC